MLSRKKEDGLFVGRFEGSGINRQIYEQLAREQRDPSRLLTGGLSHLHDDVRIESHRDPGPFGIVDHFANQPGQRF